MQALKHSLRNLQAFGGSESDTYQLPVKSSRRASSMDAFARDVVSTSSFIKIELKHFHKASVLLTDRTTVYVYKFK